MTRYFVDEDEVSYEEFYKALETVVYNYCEDAFDEHLDEGEDGEVDLLGITYSLHHVLWETDPTRYNVMLSDYQSEEFTETLAEFDRGVEEMEIYGTTFRVEEVEDEDDD